MASDRVLVLALDAAEPSLCQRWAAEGKLPNIKLLIDQGITARLENPPGLSGATWPTLNTGVTVARHGRYYYSQLRPRSYRMQLVSPRNIDIAPFWSALSDAGKRVVIVDVPKTYPIRGLNGIQIVDWANHDGQIIEGFLTWPETLRYELDRRFGADPFQRRVFSGGRGPSDFGAFMRGLCANVERKAALIQELIAEEPWDLLFASWDDAHWAGHFGWRLHDENHPHHDPAQAAAFGDPIEQVLVTADRCIGEILRLIDSQTRVVLLLSHGMGPGYRTCEILDPILRSLEGIPVGVRRQAYGQLRQLWDCLPSRVHRPLTGLKDFVRERLLAKDRAQRRYFSVPSTNDGGLIRLNVIGRDPDGKIRPGTDYDACCDWLTAELKAIEDSDTGHPIVRDVFKLRDHFHGERQDLLPDLSVEWNPVAPSRRIRSPRIGEFEVTVSPWRSGEHLPDGMVVIWTPGSSPDTFDGCIRAQDFAPTVAAMLGVELSCVDGHPVEDLIGAPLTSYIRNAWG